MQLTLFDELYEVRTAEEELLERLMLRGTGIENGKKRIHKFVMTKPAPDRLAKFLRREFGIGGFVSPTREFNYIHNEAHDKKGIQFIGIDRNGNPVEGNITWAEAAEAVLKIAKKGVHS